MMATVQNSAPTRELFIRQRKKMATAVRFPLWLKIVIGIILVFSGMMLYVWKNIQVASLAKEISTLKKQEEYLINENKSLDLDIASLSHLARIEQIAKEELGLQYPEAYPIVFKMIPSEEHQGVLAYLGITKIKAIVREVKSMVVPAAEAGSMRREQE